MAESRVTPASVFKQGDKVEAAKYHRDIVTARAEGVAEGRTIARKEAVDWLQEKYLGDDAPARNTPEGDAILTITRELVQYMLGKTR